MAPIGIGKLTHGVRTLITEAQDHYAAGRLSDAEAAYRAALAHSPGDPGITHNLGVVVAAQGQHQASLRYFEEAIAAEPRNAAAHYSLPITLLALERTAEPIKAVSRTCALEPRHYEAHRALGFLWQSQGKRGRSLDHFGRTYELRRGEDRTNEAAGSLTSATRLKLLHDARQFRYLASRRRG